jgi:WD40 repeat protein
VRALPRLTAGFLVENRDLWVFRVLTPGDAPRARLAAAFDIAADVLIEEGASAIVGQLSTQPDAASKNCLLLVDQFEEIFSFIDVIAKRDEAADFVGILLALAAQRDFPLFVVLTMRSDFLGDCDVFHGFPEAVNQSHYLVPRLTRSSRQEVIEGPVRLFGRTITPQLVDRVLNDLGDDQDQLPVMQHALLRTWERWQRDGAEGPIDLSHYLAVGGVREALSRDADAALEGMSDEERQLTIRVFQALTDTDVNNRPVRRYAKLSELERETGASRAAIQRVVERFRESGRSFLVVRQDPTGDDASIHISHESLIRQWASLRDWVEKERRSRDRYLRLVDLAQRHAQGQEGLLRDAGLQLTLDWRKKKAPSEAWARRYHDDFRQAMSFLAASEAQRERERLEKEERHRLQLDLAEERGRSRARARLLLVAGVLTVAALVFAVIARQQSLNAKRQTDVAESRRLALHALSHAERELDLAMLWSVEAFQVAPTTEALSGLLTLVGSRPHPSQFLHAHTADVRAVAFAPGGKIAVSAGDDDRIIVWNLETGEPRPLEVPKGWAKSVAFSPDGRLLAAGGQDGSVVRNATTWQVVKTLASSNRREALCSARMANDRPLAPTRASSFGTVAPPRNRVTGHRATLPTRYTA